MFKRKHNKLKSCKVDFTVKTRNSYQTDLKTLEQT